MAAIQQKMSENLQSIQANVIAYEQQNKEIAQMLKELGQKIDLALPRLNDEPNAAEFSEILKDDKIVQECLHSNLLWPLPLLITEINFRPLSDCRTTIEEKKILDKFYLPVSERNELLVTYDVLARDVVLIEQKRMQGNAEQLALSQVDRKKRRKVIEQNISYLLSNAEFSRTLHDESDLIREIGKALRVFGDNFCPPGSRILLPVNVQTDSDEPLEKVCEETSEETIKLRDELLTTIRAKLKALKNV